MGENHQENENFLSFVTTGSAFQFFSIQNLGPLACSLIPFFQTMVVLVNSIFLVCIALDRYMAVLRIVKGTWEPGKLFCTSCCVLIWGFSAAVSSPLLTLYDFFEIYIVPLPNPEEENLELTYYVGNLCGSDKGENGYFFVIIFSFIFVPLLIAFLWLNSVLAKKVWKRRIDVSVISIENESASTSTTATSNVWRAPDIHVPSEVSARRVNENSDKCECLK